MKKRINALAVTALFASPGIVSAANTISFSGEVTDQTCSVVVDGNTDPTVMLNSVPVSALTGAVGGVAGETSFTVQLSGCVAPAAASQEHFTALFQAVNPTENGNLANTASGGATGVALQLLTAPGGTPVNLAGGSAVAAGDIVLDEGQTSTSYDYAIQYVSEAVSVTPGPVLASLNYTLRYE
jgi:major type 1 subunit fimbrin (pilin)